MLGGLLLAPVLIVHILVEHLMYAWWVITCPCSNSAHIGRTSDVCMVLGYYLPCSNSAHIYKTSDVCLVDYYLPMF